MKSRFTTTSRFILSLLLAASISSVQALRSSTSGAAGTVMATGTMATPRSGHTATLLPNGTVLVAGGMERNGVFHASVELYDPARGTFTPAGSMTSRRVCHTATLLTNG